MQVAYLWVDNKGVNMKQLTFGIVGSRTAGEEDCNLLYDAALTLLHAGWKGVSGGAEGPDDSLTLAIRQYLKDIWPTATEIRGSRIGEIHIAWNGFNNLNHGDLCGCVVGPGHRPDNVLLKAVVALARGGLYNLSDGGMKLHERNVFEILTKTLNDPVDILLLSAPKGMGNTVKGGTATAYALAKALGIPTINLQEECGRAQLKAFIEEVPSITTSTQFRVYKKEPYIKLMENV